MGKTMDSEDELASLVTREPPKGCSTADSIWSVWRRGEMRRADATRPRHERLPNFWIA